ncbi:MAG: hypothetical protein MZU79_05735 [Anaerotruncus sp.]|nr:hypothetical protein [Anaerotruncus sp.]
MKDLILAEKKKGKTIVITTHLMSDVEQLCDQVVFMTKGRLSEMASPRDLKIKYGKREVAVEYQAETAACWRNSRWRNWSPHRSVSRSFRPGTSKRSTAAKPPWTTSSSS